MAKNKNIKKKSKLQCFFALYYHPLKLEAVAEALRDDFLAKNPAVAKKWRAKNTGVHTWSDWEEEREERERANDPGKKKEKDSTAIVRFRTLATKQAWANATEEQKAQTEIEWQKQDSQDQVQSRVSAERERHLARLEGLINTLDEKFGIVSWMALSVLNQNDESAAFHTLSSRTLQAKRLNKASGKFTKALCGPFTELISAAKGENSATQLPHGESLLLSPDIDYTVAEDPPFSPIITPTSSAVESQATVPDRSSIIAEEELIAQMPESRLSIVLEPPTSAVRGTFDHEDKDALALVQETTKPTLDLVIAPLSLSTTDRAPVERPSAIAVASSTVQSTPTSSRTSLSSSKLELPPIATLDDSVDITTPGASPSLLGKRARAASLQTTRNIADQPERKRVKTPVNEEEIVDSEESPP